MYESTIALVTKEIQIKEIQIKHHFPPVECLISRKITTLRLMQLNLIHC